MPNDRLFQAIKTVLRNEHGRFLTAEQIAQVIDPPTSPRRIYRCIYALPTELAGDIFVLHACRIGEPNQYRIRYGD